jgi:hypothetical protein
VDVYLLASRPPFITWWNDLYLLPWSLLWARVTFQFDHFTVC